MINGLHRTCDGVAADTSTYVRVVYVLVVRDGVMPREKNQFAAIGEIPQTTRHEPDALGRKRMRALEVSHHCPV